MYNSCVCVVEGCGPPEVNAGTTVHTSGTDVGDYASYTCAPDYDSFTGDEERECMEDGTWSGTAPSCSPKEEVNKGITVLL